MRLKYFFRTIHSAGLRFPLGASSGAFEAHESRDGDKNRYLGKGVQNAVRAVVEKLDEALLDFDATDQRAQFDMELMRIDGTFKQSQAGRQTLFWEFRWRPSRAAAESVDMPLSSLLGRLKRPTVLPVPLMNIINGGARR